jgi:hypothetical protein
MKKFLIIGLIALGLASCSAFQVGINVYVGAKGGPALLGTTVARNNGASFVVVKLCDGQLFSVQTDSLIITQDTCPYNE